MASADVMALQRLLAAVRDGATPPESPLSLRRGEIDLLRERDPGAWRDLFERDMPAIYRYVAGRVGHQEAEDITSHVFAEAWKHASTLQDRGVPARAWLFGIARNVVNDHRRKWVRKPPELHLADYEAASSEGNPSAELMDLARAVATLPRAQAEVVVMRFIHGLSLAETATALGASVDSVKARQARALHALRTMLALRPASSSVRQQSRRPQSG